MVAAALVALIQFLCMVRLIGPGLVSSYPSIEFDGFDWVLEGLYIHALAAGRAGPPLLFLRSPVFVLVTALDAFLGSNCIVVVGSLCLAQFLSLATLLAIWRRLGVSGCVQAALFVAAVPHERVPVQFELLRPSLAMAAFYATVCSKTMSDCECPRAGLQPTTPHSTRESFGPTKSRSVMSLTPAPSIISRICPSE